MYRNVVTEMSPDRNSSDRISQTKKACSVWPHNCCDW